MVMLTSRLAMRAVISLSRMGVDWIRIQGYYESLFSLSCASYVVSKLAALAQALQVITLSSPSSVNSPE